MPHLSPMETLNPKQTKLRYLDVASLTTRRRLAKKQKSAIRQLGAGRLRGSFDAVLDGVERLDDIRLDVCVVLDAAGHAHEVILNPNRRALLRPLVPVAHHRGLLDERLDAAEGRRDVRQAAVIDELGRRPQVALDLKGYHAAETVHVLLRNLVVGVRGEAGVVNLLDHRVLLQHRRQLHRVLVVPLDPELKRLDAAHDHVRCVGIDDAAEDVVKLANLRHRLLVADDRAGQNVVVPAEVLGSGVDDEVGAVLERLEVDGRGEGSVDAHEASLGFAQLGNALDVHAPQVRVRRGLGEVERAVVLIERLLESVVIGRVQHRAGHAHLGHESLHELPGPPVAVSGGDDVPVRGDEREEHADGGVHPGRGQEAVLAALQQANLLLARLRGRVTVPAVLERSVVALLIVDELLGVLEPVGGGHAHGRGE
mmetsp:Transcript_2765/g.11277  ORF Transcript_2765/g.11277 Transcript_2765/m.11277 type:complete len:425 (+) Transcript_2765:227-1501(+)